MQDAGWTSANGGKAKIARTARIGFSFLAFPGLAAVVLTSGIAVKASDDVAENKRISDSHNSETIVCLYATAIVEADQITLTDIARIEGESARLASSWVIAPAPRSGTSKNVDLNTIQSVLARRGANLSQWIFRGSSQCKVTRAADKKIKDTSDSIVSSDHKNAENTIRNTLDSPTVSEDQRCDPNTLEGLLRTHLSTRLANISGKKVIQFNPSISKLLALSKPTYDFHIVDRSDRLLGTMPLEVTIYEQKQVKQVLQVLADVTLRRPVVVATRQINRHETLQSGDVEIKEKIFSRLEELGLTDPKPLVGQRASHYIGCGSMVLLRDIESVPLVQRNDLVTVRVQRGNFIIKGSAKAMEPGGYGDSIELKNEMSKQTFTAVVTGYKTAEIPNAGGVSPAKPVLTKGDR